MRLLCMFCLIAVFYAVNCFSAVVHSDAVGGADWSDPNAWETGSVPGCGDTVIIDPGEEITITSQIDYQACIEPMFIIIHGVLSFPGNGPKLDLPCGSGIAISSGGLLTANGSNGNSNFITICGNGNSNTVWKASDGDQTDTGFGTVPPDIIVLSIELKSFYGNHFENSNRLYWTTASEMNNDYFELERTTDGLTFTFVGFVDGAGNSGIERTYEFKDHDFERGTINYYRLKWVDFNGEEEYSDIISIDNLNNKRRAIVGVFNLLGQPIDVSTSGIKVFLYSDGTSEKKYSVE